MDEKEISKLIKCGEGTKLEFKSSPSNLDRIAEIACSFANAKGGHILIGISDDRKIVGVGIGRQTIERLTDSIVDNSDPKIYPEIDTIELDGKNIIAVRIEESGDKPHSVFNKPFIRVGKNTKPMSRGIYNEMLHKRSRKDIYYDSEICASASVRDIDWNKVKWFMAEYKALSGRSIVSDNRKLLEGLGCIRKDMVTNAGMLLFGKEPAKFIPQNQITIVRYPGESVSDRYLDIKDFYGNLFDLIDKADDYIKEHIQIASRLVPTKVSREEIPEYPFYAIRELIVNAVAHRDYFISGSRIIIKMYEGRIDYSSPGGFPAGITAKNILHKQASRNPILVKVLNQLKYIEAIGDGVDRIYDAVKNHPLKPDLPVFKDVGNTVIVSLFGADMSRLKTEEKMTELNERQKRAVEYLNTTGGRLTMKEYIGLCPEVNRKSLTRDMNRLIKLGLIARKGKGKRGLYYILS